MIIGVDIRVLGTGRTSGVEEYTERLLEHMVVLDPSITFKLFYAGRSRLVRRSWMDVPNVTVYETGLSNRLLSWRARLTGRPYVDDIVGGADVFFFPHFLIGPTSSRCRRVLTMHDLSFERFPELFSVQRRLWHWVQVQPRSQAHRADRILAVSESTRNDLMRLYDVTGEKITVVHSGIDPLLHPVPGAKSGKRFILALGTLEPRKNIAALIQAFKSLDKKFQDVELVIAGPEGWLWDSVSGERIRFVGDVGREERLRLLSSATVLAYPSLFEGFGFPPLEAMACGTPVIVGANSSMVEVCGSAAVAVDPYDVLQIRDALEAVLGDSRLREHLIFKGLEHVRQFTWTRMAGKALETIISTLP